MTLDILICSFNKGVLHLSDILAAPHPSIRYIISYQYTDKRFLELLSTDITSRRDVEFHAYQGQGLSYNRNRALEHATADLVMFADDDSRLTEGAFEHIVATFMENAALDIAFFAASTYTGRPLKKYPTEEHQIQQLSEQYTPSAIEMVFRREKVQGQLRFDERFGLGTQFLTCGEDEVWLYDALNKGLHIRFFPYCIVETSTMLKRTMLYVDAGVQRSKGAFTYYVHGKWAWLLCLVFAFNSSRKRLAHFVPLLSHLYQGIRYLQQHQ